MLRPIRVARARTTLTKASGHHPSGGDARSNASPAAAATGVAAHNGSSGLELGLSIDGRAGAATVRRGVVGDIRQVSFWRRVAR